jgi:8-oxo-dGTP pyrophosphatase MutT (NUDIX family)
MTLLRHIASCNRYDPLGFVEFTIAGRPAGLIRPETATYLSAQGLAEPGGDFASVSAYLARIVDGLSGAGLMARPRGEMMPVLHRWGDPAIGQIDRAGLPALGLPAFGVHVNGFVRGEHGLELWIGRRAMDRPVAPGKLDHLVAGGVTMGLTAAQTLIKEADEEAGLPPDIARRAVPAGIVSYRLDLPEGLRRDTLFVFDLELPQGIVPANRDGEVESFELWPVARVIENLRTGDDFKFNVGPVLIDFLIRHGLLDPDNEPDYAELARGLRA